VDDADDVGDEAGEPLLLTTTPGADDDADMGGEESLVEFECEGEATVFPYPCPLG
jgi:hypothetical protein